ncbi:MAG: pitrilysin family protein [Hyphomonadaceae bacterium]|nr:pitrilysin family protein [Hyphomonadaceae bacterium]
MKRLLTALAAILTLSACATSSSPQAAQSEAVAVAPLAYHFRQLPNGLRVYAMPDPNTANVSVQVWYDVGSKDDPVGRSGFAHLFEHIMFKSTRNMTPEMMDQLTESVGGFNNASTYDDFTNYYEVVPANHLQRLLWAEAERMGSLVIDEATFDSERDVVKEELRQRVLASPYGRLFYLYLPQTSYRVHPYGRPGIGSIEELDAATVEDVRAFHAQYYRPDNAVLVVAGNFDEAQFNQWVDQYFGPIATPNRPIPRVTAQEPARTAPSEYTVYEPNVPLPALMVSYPTFDARSEDMAALMVLDGILSTGESSRMYRAMVYEQQIAAQVFTNYEATRDPSVYSLFSIMSEGRSADEGLQSLDALVAGLRDAPVTQAELDEAKAELVSSTIEGRETAYGRASELADSIIRYGSPDYADRLLAAVQAVTAADVQRVARTYFDNNKRIIVRYLPEAAQNGAPEDAITTSSTIQAQRLTVAQAEIPVYTLAPEAERVQPPSPGAAVAAIVPATAERTLANGLRVIVASDHDLPLISANLRVSYGAAVDPRARAGLAGITADLLNKGTTTRSATEIASQIESLGASLAAGAGADSSTLALQTISNQAEDAFTLFADVARNPTFAGEELERSQQQSLDGLSVALSDPGSLVGLAMPRAIYGDAPYGGVASPRSIAAITRDEAALYHRTYWRPDAAVLVISGDVSAEDGFALAERHFGDWARPAAPLPAQPDASANAGAPRTIVIDLPDTGQAAVSMGVIGAPRTGPDFFPLLLANDIMGGGYSSRLSQEIRIRRGLSYGAYSGFSPRRAPGPIIASAQTRNDAAVQVAELMAAEFERIGSTDATPAEITARKASLIGDFGRDVETTAGVAGQLSALALFGLPPSRLATYVDDVNAVDAAQVRAAGARYLDQDTADLVVAGDADIFYDALRRRHRNAERISVEELDLDSTALH